MWITYVYTNDGHYSHHNLMNDPEKIVLILPDKTSATYK